MSLILDGTNGVTYPIGSGTQGAQSKVLQVVSANYGTQVTTTSSSFVTTNLTASITPLFSTSKILIQATFPLFIDTLGNGVGVSLYKNGSLLFNPSGTNSGTSGQFYLYGGAATVSSENLQYLDSPATTSSTSYAIYFCRYGVAGTAYINYGTSVNGQSTITLMEIAA